MEVELRRLHRPDSEGLELHQKGRGFSDLMGFCDDVETTLGRRVVVVTDDGLSPFLRERVLAEAVPL